MINPMVFRRMTKSWRIDELLPYAEDFYRTFGKECEKEFYHSIVIRRIFSSEQEKGYWIDKQHKDEFSDYLTTLTEEDNSFSSAHNPFGTGRVKKAAYVSTVEFLSASKQWFADHHTVITENFDFSLLDPVELTYKGKRFDDIVFCEGVEVIHNPYFKHIAVNHTKGETLTIISRSIPETESLNRKCFVLPIGNEQFRVGATYAWDTYESLPTPEGKQELIEKLAVLTDASYEVIDHQAGIRPTTMDRRPILGSHSDFKGLHVFNGLGTKGYMIAPLLAKEMGDYILTGKPLSKEVEIDRFKK
jgi:hypothetical protein